MGQVGRTMAKKKIKGDAEISVCGKYRYWLSRRWKPRGSEILFILLNPSTADAKQDDPTLRRCIGFAQRWKFSALTVVNLFGYRATDPSELKLLTREEAEGPDNDDHIKEQIDRADLVLVGWGTNGGIHSRDEAVLDMLYRPMAIGRTRDGFPKHPLYISAEAHRFHYHKF